MCIFVLCLGLPIEGHTGSPARAPASPHGSTPGDANGTGSVEESRERPGETRRAAGEPHPTTEPHLLRNLPNTDGDARRVRGQSSRSDQDGHGGDAGNFPGARAEAEVERRACSFPHRHRQAPRALARTQTPRQTGARVRGLHEAR